MKVVVSIDLFFSHFVHFRTMEYVKTYYSVLFDVIVSQKGSNGEGK